MRISKTWIFTLASICLSAGALRAQDNNTWKITLNKKVVLKGDGNSPDTAVLRLTKADLSNNNIFRITYDQKNELKGWQRSIAIMDTNQVSVAQRDSVSEFLIYNKDVMGILWPRKKIGIYTWSAPLDKGVAAAIRIRRIRLCTIELID